MSAASAPAASGACVSCGCTPPPPVALSAAEKKKLEQQAKLTKIWETTAWIVIGACSAYADRKVFLAFAGVGAAYEFALYAMGFDRHMQDKHKHGIGCGNGFGKTLIGAPLFPWESILVFPAQDALAHLFHHDWRFSFSGFAGECIGVRTALCARSFFTAPAPKH